MACDFRHNETFLGLDENDLQVLNPLNGVGKGMIDDVFSVQKFERLKCRHQAF